MNPQCERPRCQRQATVFVRSTGSGRNPKPWTLRVCDQHATPYVGMDSRPGVHVTTEEHT